MASVVARKLLPLKLDMLASETHGNPLGKFDATACCDAPAETSVTEPVMTVGAPTVADGEGTVTVVLLGPCPYA